MALGFGATSASVFCRSSASAAAPDLQLLFFPGSFNPAKYRELEREPGLRISVSLAHPASRGRLDALSTDPLTPDRRRPDISTKPPSPPAAPLIALLLSLALGAMADTTAGPSQPDLMAFQAALERELSKLGF